MEENFNIHLGKKLRMRRLALGLTQTKVAQAINVTFQQIQKYEKGTNGVAFSADYKYYIHTFEDSNTPTQYNLRSTATGKVIRPIEDNAGLKNKLTKKKFYKY